MTDDGWKGGQDSQAYVDHLKAEAMTDDEIDEQRRQAEAEAQRNMTDATYEPSDQ